MATAYTFIIDPVLIYTFNFSCKVLNEKVFVYMRTGSLGTAYTVIIDPVLIIDHAGRRRHLPHHQTPVAASKEIMNEHVVWSQAVASQATRLVAGVTLAEATTS